MAKRNLDDAAEEIWRALKDNFDTPNREMIEVLCLAEEIGEFIGAYRRYKGMARRSGPWEDVVEELADVMITARVVSKILNIDIEQAQQDKLEKIFTRGWKEILNERVGDLGEGSPSGIKSTLNH